MIVKKEGARDDTRRSSASKIPIKHKKEQAKRKTKQPQSLKKSYLHADCVLLRRLQLLPQSSQLSLQLIDLPNHAVQSAGALFEVQIGSADRSL